MIYLIGGPPKCGKTTLAKQLSKKLGIPWVGSDTLQVVAQKYISKYVSKLELAKLYPHNAQKGKTNDETYSMATPKQIAKNYIKQARASYDAIDMFSVCEIADGNDCIIEGYHVTPRLASRLIKKYGRKNFKAIFLVKEDANAFVKDCAKSLTPNDWVLCRTKNKETLHKIGKMISFYGKYFRDEAKKYGFKVLNMDKGFKAQMKKAVDYIEK